MIKARLLAGSVLPFLALGQAAPLSAGPDIVVAQQTAPEDAKKKQAPKKDSQGQPPAAKQPSQAQPPAAKQPGQTQPPAARGQPPSGQPPAAKSALPPAQTTPPAAKSAQPPAQTQPPAAKSAQPPASTTPPAGPAPAARTAPSGQPVQPPAARRTPPGQAPAAQQPTRTQPPAAGRTPPAAPPAAQGQKTPGEPQQPAARTQSGQPPAAGQTPPAAQGKTQPPAQGQPATAGQPAPFAKRQPGAPIAVQPTGSQGQPIRRVEDLRRERHEERRGDQVVIREGDRTIIRFGDRAIIRHNEADRFRHAGREVAVDRRGGEVRTVIERPDGTRIITVTDENGRLLRRIRRTREGREIVIIDNRVLPRPGGRADFYVELPPPVIRIPRERYIVEADRASREDIYATLVAPPVERIDRRYSLEEVRYSPALRQRMPRIDIDSITFDSGSWEIAPDQLDALAVIAEGINRALARNPGEVFMIEGHTDAVGQDVDNLSLSDRRAESVALALSEQFQVPAENLTTQGYGEQHLKVPAEGPERQNRRVSVVRITPLLNGQSAAQAN
jgi:outer membrane protein OmpA-like peptidoglycan-associated protein